MLERVAAQESGAKGFAHFAMQNRPMCCKVIRWHFSAKASEPNVIVGHNLFAINVLDCIRPVAPNVSVRWARALLWSRVLSSRRD
jgi:hypothetical protein